MFKNTHRAQIYGKLLLQRDIGVKFDSCMSIAVVHLLTYTIYIAGKGH